MMDDRIKRWLSTVASQLDLPRKQQAVVLEELKPTCRRTSPTECRRV